MYNIEEFRADIEEIKKNNEILKKTIEIYENYIENKYVEISMMNAYDYCELSILDQKFVIKNIKLQEIIKQNNNNIYEKEIFLYNELNNQYINYLKKINELKKTIEIYIDNYLYPLTDIYGDFFAITETSTEDMNYIIKTSSNLFITNDIIIPKDDFDSIINYIANINDEIINNFIQLIYKKIQELNLINNENSKSGIEIYKNEEINTEIPKLEDIVNDIKKRKNF